MEMFFYGSNNENSSETTTEDEEYEYQHLRTIEKILEDSDDEIEDINTENQTGKYKLITRRIDSNRIRHKIATNPEIHTSVCKNMKTYNEGPMRSGAIIYTHYGGETYFCLGVDSVYGDLTDFAGGVKKGEMSEENGAISGGLRELEEESLGIFGKLTVEDVSESLVFYSTSMMIMFIHLDIDIEKTKKDFQISARDKRKKIVPGEFTADLEVSDICWLEKKEFLESVSGKGRRIYSRVRKILSKVTEIIQAL